MAAIDDRRFLDACALVRRFVPGYRAVMKSDSRLMRAIGWVLLRFGNTQFSEEFWTTVNGVTYRPLAAVDGAVPDEWVTTLHEGRHAVDAQRIGQWAFNAGYLLPQLLALPAALCAAIGLCLASWPLAVTGLVLLALAAPLPAPFRAWAEFRGYATSMACTVWSGRMGTVDYYLDKFVGPMFTGPAYYWQWPFRARVRARFERELARAIDVNVGRAEPADAYEAACYELAFRYRAEDAATQPTPS